MAFEGNGSGDTSMMGDQRFHKEGSFTNYTPEEAAAIDANRKKAYLGMEKPEPAEVILARLRAEESERQKRRERAKMFHETPREHVVSTIKKLKPMMKMD